MERLAVGELYLPGRTSWPETVDINPLTTGIETRVFFTHPSQHEIQQMQRAPAEIALTAHANTPIISLRYGDLQWMDCPVDAVAVPVEQRMDLTQALVEHERLLMTHFLIDAATGILRVIRATTLSPTLSRRLIELWREQVASGCVMDRPSVERMYASMSPAGVAANAEIREQLGSPHTV